MIDYRAPYNPAARYQPATLEALRNRPMLARPESWPEFWAVIASVTRIADLTPGERLLLLEAYMGLVEAEGRVRVQQGHNEAPRWMREGRSLIDVMNAPDRDKAAASWLQHAHEQAHATIIPLLEGKDVVPPLETRTTWRLEASGRRVMRELRAEQLETPAILGLLYELIESATFPWGRCQREECKAVFVRRGRRMYCSTRCTLRAADDARKQLPARKRQIAEAKALARAIKRGDEKAVARIYEQREKRARRKAGEPAAVTATSQRRASGPRRPRKQKES